MTSKILPCQQMLYFTWPLFLFRLDTIDFTIFILFLFFQICWLQFYTAEIKGEQEWIILANERGPCSDFFIALITNCCNFLSKYFGTQIILGNNSVQKCTYILVMDWVLLETRVSENHQICRYCNYFAKNEDNFIIFPLLPDIPKNSISDTQTITTVHT